MTTTDDRLSQLRQQLSESVARLGELDAAAINAVVGGKTERDISAIETRKAQARERIVLLGKAITELERTNPTRRAGVNARSDDGVHRAADQGFRRRGSQVGTAATCAG